jgi:hypothetical protein
VGREGKEEVEEEEEEAAWEESGEWGVEVESRVAVALAMPQMWVVSVSITWVRVESAPSLSCGVRDWRKCMAGVLVGEALEAPPATFLPPQPPFLPFATRLPPPSSSSSSSSLSHHFLEGLRKRDLPVTPPPEVMYPSCFFLC